MWPKLTPGGRARWHEGGQGRMMGRSGSLQKRRAELVGASPSTKMLNGLSAIGMIHPIAQGHANRSGRDRTDQQSRSLRSRRQSLDDE